MRRLRAEANADKRFALFLGAGCSVTSGIPAAGTLVQDRWIPRLHSLLAPDRKDLDTWVREVIPGYESKTPALSYGSLINRLFLTPDDRQREIEDLCEGRAPAFGYAVLAQLLARDGGRFNVVLTTNFDDLIADALYLYTEARPLVIHHEALAGYIRPTRTRPLVIKLHGDHRLSPRNTTLETQTLAQEFQKHAAMVLHDRGIIFMGYGGADLGILKMLNDLPAEALPFGAYWVHPEEPSGQVREWLSRRQGVWVRSGWFDDVMLLIRNEFALSHPSPDRFTRIFNEYQRKFQELSTSIQLKPGDAAELPALKKAITDTEALFPDFWKPLSEASRLESVDADGADHVYRKGIEQFPNAAPLLGNYANFLWQIRKDHDAAETMYKRALEADPKHPVILGNYASFLWQVRKEHDAVETIYKRALEADPKNAINLGNYASFLGSVRKDYDAADALFKRALEADPKGANNLGSYAIFLQKVRKDDDGAEVLFKRALEADPKNANNLGSYASFLRNVRKDQDAEGIYKRALEVDPKHAMNLGNFANFLWHVRKNDEAAEAMYKQALEADPKNFIHLGNYAGFLLAKGRASGLALLHQALAASHGELPPDGELECSFYLVAHGSQSERIDGLGRAKRLLQSSIRSPYWDLSQNVQRAQADGHPDGPWLEKLAAVINGVAEPAVLNGWPAWENAGA